MKISANWRLAAWIILVLIAHCWTVGAANAQASLCVKEHMLRQTKDSKPLGIAASEAHDLIQKVASSISLGVTITVVPCSFIRKAVAWRATGNIEGVPNGDYIIYDPTWIREVIGSDRVQAIALFGHELGHFLNGHFGPRDKLTSEIMEIEADRFAGCAVARLGGDWQSLENLLSRLRNERDELYPSRLKSIEAAKSGFDTCGTSKPAVPISAAQAQTAAFGSKEWKLAATADLRARVWYDKGYAKPAPTTLKAALSAEKEFLGADHQGWKPLIGAPGLREVCAALNAVKLPCDYNTRITLSEFLSFYGRGLFPAAGGTNPYCTAEQRERERAEGTDTRPDDCFVGQPRQNKMLADAIRNNRRLFKNGDISGETIRKNWK